MLSKRKRNQILAQLSSEERTVFLDELLEVLDEFHKTGNFKPVEECVDSWEATAELNAIPGVKEKVWDRFNRLKKTGAIHG